ncbi:MAG: GWxTD domain-containing protein [Thermoanaerobaculia bacterium]|nr:GWxTD domain-containing protein [Thermoanaerobaculia bacterium]
MRKLRLLATLVALVALALPATAELDKFKDWDKSPEFTYYATDDERQAWTAVKTDDEAQKFNNLFWGRRHPNYQTTAENAFRARFDALAAEADRVFTMGKKRGALTERGKVLILLGPPKAIASRVDASAAPDAGIGGEEGAPRLPAAGGGMTLLTQFQYEKEQLPEWAGSKRLLLTFTVDQVAQTESVDKPGEVKKLWKKAVSAALVNPKMTEPPRYKTIQEHEAELKAAAEAAAEAAKGPVLSEPVRAALEAALAKEAHGGIATLPIAFGDKATHLMLQLPVPADARPAAPADPTAAAAKLKVAVLVKSKDGKDAARREEPAELESARGDLFVDLAAPVEPGDYDVAAILLDDAGAVKASSRASVTVPPLPEGLGLSSLLLAATDLPAEGAKGDEPFVFATRKFVARAGNAFLKTDGLAYVARLYNPAVDPATKKLHIKREISIKPKTGSSIEVPQSADDPMPVPEQEGASMALIIDVAGAIDDEKLGDYFRPGEYTMTLKVTDLVAGKSVEVKAPFTLVAPPPAAKAPDAKAPAAKK